MSEYTDREKDQAIGAQAIAGIISDLLTGAAAKFRESELTFTGPHLADYLTGLSADINRHANETFGTVTGVDL